MNDTTINPIAKLNDAFRQTFIGGTVVLTIGIQALPEIDQCGLLEAVQQFNHFTPDSDPYGEHDFGAFNHNGHRINFKIDYYDLTLTYGSEDPADPTQTKRVLTVILGEEY